MGSFISGVHVFFHRHSSYNPEPSARGQRPEHPNKLDASARASIAAISVAAEIQSVDLGQRALESLLTHTGRIAPMAISCSQRRTAATRPGHDEAGIRACRSQASLGLDRGPVGAPSLRQTALLISPQWRGDTQVRGAPRTRQLPSIPPAVFVRCRRPSVGHRVTIAGRRHAALARAVFRPVLCYRGETFLPGLRVIAGDLVVKARARDSERKRRSPRLPQGMHCAAHDSAWAAVWPPSIRRSRKQAGSMNAAPRLGQAQSIIRAPSAVMSTFSGLRSVRSSVVPAGSARSVSSLT